MPEARRVLIPFVFLLSFAASPAPSAVGPPPDFWTHWGDGRAELNSYRLVQPRYGQARVGSAVYIFVTEDFSDSARVKADPGKHPPADVFPVMKLNAVRDFQTGIYDYNVMTSVFAKVAPGWPLAKASFSSQEWCGHVYHQLLPRGGRVQGVRHSYFDGEADGVEDLAHPDGGVFEDALPILLRGWQEGFLSPGAQRSVPFLPSLLRARLDHVPLAWGQATIERSAAPAPVAVPAGSIPAYTWTVRPATGPAVTYHVEAAAPFRLVKWKGADGEEGALVASERQAYWKLNGVGGEAHLPRLGLRPVGPPRR
jgi:hypothetical protein